jgi:Ino eighty subunit 1
VAHDHFGCRDIDFLDLFLPIKISSPSRARAFLWLAFHYHEAPSLNPFEDQQARKHLGLIPELIPLSEEEFEKENVDPEDERNYATKMTKLRIDFLAKNAQGAENNNRKGTAKSKVRAPSPGKSIPAKRERSDPDSAAEDESDHLGTFQFSIHLIVLLISPLGPPSRRRRPKTLNPSRALSESSISRLSNRHSGGPHRSILQRMILCSPPSALSNGNFSSEAWHVVTTVDAFLDSDDEDIDESARHAYGTSSPSMPRGVPDFVCFSHASPGTC